MELNLSEEEKVNLLSGENYILFNNLRGGINIWINSDPEMQTTIASQDFQKIAADLFPQLSISELLKALSRGSYIFTDKFCIRTLRPKSILAEEAIIPSLQSALITKRKNQQRKSTPFGISFSVF